MIGCSPSMLVSRPILVFALVLAAVVYSDEAHAQSCPEFQKRVAERTVGEHQGTRDLLVTGDFDGNGGPDHAFFAIIGDRISLVVCLHGHARAFKLTEVSTDVSYGLTNMGIRLADPGAYDHPCIEGMGPGCPPGEKLRLELESPAILLFTYESASGIRYWDGDRFESFPQS